METKKMLDKNGLEYYTGKIKQQIPKKTSDLTNDSGFIDGLVILSYGSSNWNDFITAYNKKKVVYCRASSNSNPASGSQTRLAFMAYVNNALSPTEVEFQYYRSVSSHTDSQQGDQVYVYKLTSSGKWTVTVRNAFSKVVAGTGLSSSYSSGAITLSANAQTETDPVFSASAASGITSSDITSWNNKSDFSGSYNDLTDLPVPTDIRINNSSIISGGVANLGVTPDYDSSTNPLATMGAVSQGMNAVTSLINRKQDTLVSGTNIKTINNESLLGSGNIEIEAGTCVEQSSTVPTDTDIVLWIEDSDIDGSGGGGGTSIEVIDSLISTSTTNALSANQGRVLNGKITAIESDYLTSTNIKDNLTTDSATDALSAKQGKVLDTRVAALEGDNLDSRLDTLEGQNLDTRLDTIEAKNLVESTNISKIVMVTEYPSTPDPDTLYVKVASL